MSDLGGRLVSCVGFVTMIAIAWLASSDRRRVQWPIVGWGVAGGCYGPVMTAALPNFFGRTHLGAIQGVLMMSLVIASALGPAALAAFEAGFGSYAPGLYAMIALPALVFLGAPFVPDPGHLEPAAG